MLRIRSRVGPKGQAVIPKPVRDQVGIRPGDEVTFRVEGRDRVVLEKASGRDVYEALVGAFPKRRLPARIDWDAEYYSQLDDELPGSD